MPNINKEKLEKLQKDFGIRSGGGLFWPAITKEFEGNPAKNKNRVDQIKSAIQYEREVRPELVAALLNALNRIMGREVSESEILDDSQESGKERASLKKKRARAKSAT